MNNAFVLNWFEVPRSDQADVERWHNREHAFERLRLPGFNRMRRYEAAEDGLAQTKKILIAYDLRDLSALTSPEYSYCLNNPTPLTLDAVPRLRKVSRAHYDADFRIGGVGVATHLVMLELSGGDGSKQLAEELALKKLAKEAYDEDSFVTQITLGTPSPDLKDVKEDSKEGSFTDNVHREPASWIIIVEATKRENAQNAIVKLRETIIKDTSAFSSVSAPESFQLVISYTSHEINKVSKFVGGF